MDAARVERIEMSWERLAPHGGEIARLFYDRLFDLEPELQDLFVLADMGVQRDKFLEMLGAMLALMRDPTGFQAMLVASGDRHRSYGVLDRHYAVVGEALMYALGAASEQGLSPTERDVWAEAYTLMASHMRRSGPAS